MIVITFAEAINQCLLAFIMAWNKDHDMIAISKLARETLVLVPLGLPFFVPLAMFSKTGLSFWPSFGLGVVMATLTIGAWFRFGLQVSP